MDRPPFIVWFEHSSVAAAAISGVLAARGRRIDLFGVSVLALVTAFGGGTVRDLCLGDTPVFWIRNSDHVLTALAFAFLTFFSVRFWQLPLPPWLLELADAIGLSLFAIIGLVLIGGDAHINTAFFGIDQFTSNRTAGEHVGLHQHLALRSANRAHDRALGVVPWREVDARLDAARSSRMGRNFDLPLPGNRWCMRLLGIGWPASQYPCASQGSSLAKKRHAPAPVSQLALQDTGSVSL